MTTKTYKYGKHYCKAYKKPCGKGFEVGMTYAGQPCFVGNFIHAREATAWWTKMNYELKKFGRKYTVTQMAPATWTRRFLSNYMYKCYYTYLDREFTKYQRGFTQAVKRDVRRYTHFKKTWGHRFTGTYTTFRRSA
jgi:hypothetical protein